MGRGGGTSSSAGAYEPGIDGLRAVAVGLVLLFHAPFGWASGGFLGVSLFFTLSGFLITRLLVAEHASSGRIDLIAFWTRRLRRLAPAATACIVLALALAPWIVAAEQRRGLRWDAWSALTYWANWRSLAGGQGYSELFADPGPLDHFWSLAIEEQFYVVVPALTAVVLTRFGRRGLALVVGGITALSVLASVCTDSADLVYAGTHTRAAELLIGALAALAVSRWPDVTAARTTGAVGALGLAVVVTASGTVGLSDGWLYEGGLAAIAVASAAAVVGATAPGPLRRVLSAAPLVAVGRRSYGLYLVHWPLYLLLSPDRTGLDGAPLLAGRLAASGALAWASYRWLEQPIRARERLRDDRRMVAATGATAGAVAVLAALGTLGVAPAASATAAVADGVTDFGALRRPAASPAEAEPDGPAVTSAPRVRIAIVGSAAADTVADALTARAEPVRIHCDLPACAAAGTTVDMTIDAAVVVLGQRDRDTVDGLTGDAQVDAFVTLAEALAAVVDRYTDADVPVVLADAGPDDFLRSRLGVLDLSSELVVAADPADAAAAAASLADASPSRPGDDGRITVLIVGDSTSYGIADGLHAAAGDRVHVLWAGGANCPLVPAIRMRWWEGNEFDTSECPTVETWAEAAAGLEPDVVLAVSSFAEQTELQLGDADGWSVVGDPAVDAAHDRWLTDVRALAARSDAVVVVADSPPFAEGSFAEGSFADAPMADAGRIASWNSTIRRWDEAYDDVVRLPWTDILGDLEASGTVRGDGVHLDHEARPQAGALVADAVEAIVTGLPGGRVG